MHLVINNTTSYNLPHLSRKMMEEKDVTVNHAQSVKPEINIRLMADSPDKIQFVDTLELTEIFKVNTLTPYLHDLYNALSSKTSTPELGISRGILLQVTLFFNLSE